MSDQVSTQQAGAAGTGGNNGAAPPTPAAAPVTAAAKQATRAKTKANWRKWTGPLLVAAVVLAAIAKR